MPEALLTCLHETCWKRPIGQNGSLWVWKPTHTRLSWIKTFSLVWPINSNICLKQRGGKATAEKILQLINHSPKCQSQQASTFQVCPWERQWIPAVSRGSAVRPMLTSDLFQLKEFPLRDSINLKIALFSPNAQLNTSFLHWSTSQWV